eukprot:CAMPEP_0198712684 /NCGR_PEP_ID=MMETSP1471-20131121/4407_1 /TAXON_ID=41880 /ORGANISM="Pycnococcus provasolii, Strain RCC733" /LENGTH=465 /DNA_ID=CAMNT_0044472675 /DNA_START=123 /DNA_END=1520 /DNA_ORIENTATION=+
MSSTVVAPPSVAPPPAPGSTAPAASSASRPPAHVVGNSFVNQYYTVLQHNTKLMHRFYQDRSVLTHGGPESNKVETVTSLKDIHNKVIQLGLDGARAEISSVDSQYSHEGGVIVQVVGGLTMKDGTKRKFVQTFFLAEMVAPTKGYYVHNDIFRYLPTSEGVVPAAPVYAAPSPAPTPAAEAAAPAAVVPPPRAMSVDAAAVVPPPRAAKAAAAARAAPAATAAPAAPAVEEVEEDDNDGKPLSFADMLKRRNKQQAAAAAAAAPVAAAAAPSPAPLAAPVPLETPSAPAGTAGDGDSKAMEDVTRSIFVRELPADTTAPMLEASYGKFGKLAGGVAGINLTARKGGCYAFIEFETAASAKAATEAPCVVNGKEVQAEAKKPMAQRKAPQPARSAGPGGATPARGAPRGARPESNGTSSEGGDSKPPRARDSPAGGRGGRGRSDGGRGRGRGRGVGSSAPAKADA